MILLSWDGVRHDYPERASAPALERMAREGARAERLVPVFPSNTFPNHVSLVTGTYVDRHGIVGNHFLDTVRGRFHYSKDASWIEAEPLWVAAERQGVRAAVYYWVGSETPWRGVAATHRVTPFDERRGERAKVEQILEWLDLPASRRPGLVLSWWHGCDHVGHRRGPDHAEVARQLERQDAELGRLLAGLDARGAWGHTTLLVVSDHGMAPAGETLDLRRALDAAGIRAHVENGGGTAHVHLRKAGDRDAALDALRALPHVEAWPAEALPAALRGHFPGRSGDLVALTTPPRSFRPATGTRWLPGPLERWIVGGGAHGYDPRLPEMGAVFRAMGRGVPAGARLGEVRAIDIAPTAAALLGIDPPRASEGRALFSAAGESSR